jgi:hypothetical protein
MQLLEGDRLGVHEMRVQGVFYSWEAQTSQDFTLGYVLVYILLVDVDNMT